MEHDFWHERWARNQIGFHEGVANAMLVSHVERLDLAQGARVFVPLCGKTRDIPWLLSRGHSVAGAELSETAIRQLFDDLALTPDVTDTGKLKHFAAPHIDIFVGDIFNLDPATLGPVDAVFDRAALVALPDEMRARYAAHLPALTASAPQLLVTFEYDQSRMNGPPFSVTPDMVETCYAATYDIALLERTEIADGLKGRLPAQESAWLLTPKQ